MKINFNPQVLSYGAANYPNRFPLKRNEEKNYTPDGFYDNSSYGTGILKSQFKERYIKIQELAKQEKIKEVFEEFGIKCRQLDDEKGFIISEYRQPNKKNTFADFGIDENKLLENVVRVEGDVDFERSQATSAKNIKSIGGHLKAVDYRNNINLSSLESIGTNIDISFSEIKSLPKLKYIGGWAYFLYSKISDLTSLKYVQNWLSAEGTPLKNLPSIEYIGGRGFDASALMTPDTIARINSKLS